MALILDLKEGDVLDIDNSKIMITVEKKTGSVFRVSIDANRDIPVRKRDKKASIQSAFAKGLTQRR